MGFAGESGKYILNLFLHATLCLLNLSSGENLAGCALSATLLSGFAFYHEDHISAEMDESVSWFSTRMVGWMDCVSTRMQFNNVLTSQARMSKHYIP